MPLKRQIKKLHNLPLSDWLLETKKRNEVSNDRRGHGRLGIEAVRPPDSGREVR
jgi:hypothetical protein